MKQLLTILAMLLAFTSFSQLTQTEKNSSVMIGKARYLGFAFGELLYSVNGTDTTYQLKYKDYTLTPPDVWKSVFFKGGSETVLDLYNKFKNVLNVNNGKETNFKLGENEILAKTDSINGIPNLIIEFTSSSNTKTYMKLSSKQLDKLFDESLDDSDVQ